MQTKPEFPDHIQDQPVLFLSDVHLGAFTVSVDQALEDEIIKLIDHAEKHQIRIVILGDLFDYWMEYPSYIPKLGERLRTRFREYHSAVGPSLYVTGNHDCWTLSHFHELGFDVEPEYRVLKLGDKTGLLLHGDGLSDAGMNYPHPLLHRFLRNERFISIYQKILPPSAGISLMRLFSRISKFREGFTDNTEKLDNWAQQTLNSSRFDIIICGHHHHQRFVQTNTGLYINLGAYFNDHTLALYSDHKLTMVNWPGSQYELLPVTSHS